MDSEGINKKYVDLPQQKKKMTKKYILKNDEGIVLTTSLGKQSVNCQPATLISD